MSTGPGPALRVAALGAAVALALAAALAPRPLRAQSYTCLPADAPATAALADYARRLVTFTDPRYARARVSYRLPVAPEQAVSIVTRAAVCREAAAAYHRAAAPAGSPPVSRAVAVVKVGTSRYLVSDPAHHNPKSHYEMTVVFDAAWTVLASFAS
jgi:hypothetical protein